MSFGVSVNYKMFIRKGVIPFGFLQRAERSVITLRVIISAVNVSANVSIDSRLNDIGGGFRDHMSMNSQSVRFNYSWFSGTVTNSSTPLEENGAKGCRSGF